jgi:hypothetical protein
LINAPVSSISLLVEREGFDVDHYLRKFGPYYWTYIAGYRELLSLFALAENFTVPEATEFVKGLHMKAVSVVPKEWKISFKGAEWNKCHPDQIMIAGKGGPLRFDRACQAIKALELAVAYSRHPVIEALPFYDCVMLHPAMYAVRDLNYLAKSWLANGGDKHKDLIGKLCRREPDGATEIGAKVFLSDVAKGFAITGANADLIWGYMRECGRSIWEGSKVGMLQNRGDDERTAKAREKSNKKCSSSELPFVAPPDALVKFLERNRQAIEKTARTDQRPG